MSSVFVSPTSWTNCDFVSVKYSSCLLKGMRPICNQVINSSQCVKISISVDVIIWTLFMEWEEMKSYRNTMTWQQIHQPRLHQELKRRFEICKEAHKVVASWVEYATSSWAIIQALQYDRPLWSRIQVGRRIRQTHFLNCIVHNQCTEPSIFEWCMVGVNLRMDTKKTSVEKRLEDVF